MLLPPLGWAVFDWNQKAKPHQWCTIHLVQFGELQTEKYIMYGIWNTFFLCNEYIYICFFLIFQKAEKPRWNILVRFNFVFPKFNSVFCIMCKKLSFEKTKPENWKTDWINTNCAVLSSMDHGSTKTWVIESFLIIKKTPRQNFYYHISQKGKEYLK